MKTSTKIVTGAALVAVLVTGSLGVARAEMGFGGRHRGRATVLERLATLGVTDEQKAEIKTILREHQPQLEPLRRQFIAERRALRDVTHAEKVDEGAIRRQARKLSQVGADLAVARARVSQEIRGVLTPEQIEKARELRAAAEARVDEALDRVANALGEE